MTRNREIFIFEDGKTKVFNANTKKERRRVKKFAKKFYKGEV